jgi:NADP-dependent 3-hydroxy acid dehydrogenase YdfG
MLAVYVTVTNRWERTMAKLTGKVALVTGASAGIGRAAALALAAEGANLVVIARRADRLDALADEAAKFGVATVPVVGDLREEATAKAAVAAAVKAFGRIDILIANAGVGNYKNLVDTELADYVEMMDGNMKTSWLITRHTAPVMIAQKEGLILLVSSMAGVYGFAGEATYCATKFAQVGFAQGLDKELRPHGIKVGTINPGGVKTEFAIGKGRTEAGVAASEMLEAEDVAQAIVFAATQPKLARIIQIQMRTMAESLT